MAGNVWEWTTTASGSYRVIRGGDWTDGGYFCRCGYDIARDYPDSANRYNGFRAVRRR